MPTTGHHTAEGPYLERPYTLPVRELMRKHVVAHDKPFHFALYCSSVCLSGWLAGLFCACVNVRTCTCDRKAIGMEEIHTDGED